MSKRILLLLALVASLLLLVACAGAAPEVAPEEPAVEDEVEEVEEDEAVEEGAGEEEVPAGDVEEEVPVSEEPVGEAEAPAGVEELNIIWAQWDPANYLATLVEDYEALTGVQVNVIQEPWGSYYDRVATEWAAQGDAFDMVVGDSQWLGQAVTQGHYVDMTDFLNETGIKETVTEATLTYYAEYPRGSEQYWSYPLEGDANGWAYRKDLFEDPANMEAFEAEYGYPLGVPATWDQFMDVAQFFTRPDEGLYGAAIYTQRDYDGITMGFENVLFSYGADWSEDGEVLGVLNSPEGIAAAEYYRELYECCAPPGLTNAFFQETNDAFVSGQVAMAMNYFAFFPALTNPAINPYAETTGFFAMPAGPTDVRFAALGGQGISVSAHIPEERQLASLAFIEWLAQNEVQEKWAALGGYTCNADVLASETFLEATPYNPAFAETMNFVKDFFNNPVYGQLLEIAQVELHEYIVGGEGTAEETMNAMAEGMAAVLDEAGLTE